MRVLFSLEEWKPIRGYEGLYEVSNQGTVRSLPREVQGGRKCTVRGGNLKGSTHRSGHISVVLCNGGERKREYIHRLVYQEFVGEIPVGMEVRHLNGDPSDNRLENLRIGTRTDQRNDDIRNGVHWQSGLTLCKRGHPLDAPYICPTRAKGGSRICLPCKRAMMRKAHHGFSEEQVQKIADEIYAELQSGVTL